MENFLLAPHRASVRESTRPGQAFEPLYQFWREQPYVSISDTIDYRTWMHNNPAVEIITGSGNFLVWLLDLRNLQYVYMSPNAEKVLGYPAEEWLRSGIAFTHQLIHPEDQWHVGRLTRIVWDHLLSLPAGQRKGYKLNLDYRLRKADGGYVRLLEQHTVLQTDEGGNITHVLGVGSDISQWKKGNVVTAALLNPENRTSLVCTSEEMHAPAKAVLSKREREIVQLLAQGYGSKAIAEKLFIAVHTVNTHRQKMLEKTHVRNTSSLVQFAMNNGLI